MISVLPFLVLLCGFPGAGSGVSVEIAGIPSESGTRMELLQRSDGACARWVGVDGGEPRSGGMRTLTGEPGRAALLLLRRNGVRTYGLDGPFDWPASPGSRTFRDVERRTLRGSHPNSGALDFRLVGKGEASDLLCDDDAGGGDPRWRCLGVPADFAGRIVACAAGTLAGSAPVRPDGEDTTALAKTDVTAAIRVVGGDEESLPAGARVVRPVTPGSDLLAPPPGYRIADLGDGILWVEGDGDPAGARIEITAPGFATRRVEIADLPAVCGGPVRVQLTVAIGLRGTVSRTDGSRVVAATVIARSEEPAKDPRIFADATTDDDGEFVLGGLEPRVYRLLVCHGELGCREERASPGEAVRIVLEGGGSFAGRAMSSAGVPEVDAAVQIVPTAGAWTASADRLRKLPLQTTSGHDGRFRIAAPDPGDYWLEVRGTSGGVARRAVRRTNLSPPVTDLGDLRLSEPIRFAARVPGCAPGWLTFSGPLGGETSLPAVLRFRLDPSGATSVELAEPGAWTVWATCAGKYERVLPSLLPDVTPLQGVAVDFEWAREPVEPR